MREILADVSGVSALMRSEIEINDQLIGKATECGARHTEIGVDDFGLFRDSSTAVVAARSTVGRSLILIKLLLIAGRRSGRRRR